MYSVLQTEEFESWLDDLRDRKARTAKIRIHYGPGYRLYFTKQGLFVIVLLCGGEKGSQKRDLKKAREMAAQL